MLVWKIVFKNIIRSGLRTWLNVSIMALVSIIIVFFNGFLAGWDEQARRDSVQWDFGQGQLTHALYDKYDAFSIQVGNGVLPDGADKNHLTPALVWPATIYPRQTELSVLLKGLPKDQTVLKLPTKNLGWDGEGDIPVVMGDAMAEVAGAKIGDRIMVRWRDKDRTFDATTLVVVDIFNSHVPTADGGFVYLDLDVLWDLTQLQGHATYWIADEGYQHDREFSNWVFLTKAKLLEPFDALMEEETVSTIIINLVLLSLALLAVFDTQVIMVFRRQREIGTYVSLGMTRLQVVRLFTLEAAMYGLLGMGVAGIVGTPLFYYLHSVGIPLGMNSDQMGIPISDIIIPVFRVGTISLVGGIVFATTTLVGFIPAKKIANMRPAEAIKGKAI